MYLRFLRSLKTFHNTAKCALSTTPVQYILNHTLYLYDCLYYSNKPLN